MTSKRIPAEQTAFLAQVEADLDELAKADPDGDPGPIIRKAAEEMKERFPMSDDKDPTMRRLQQLPDIDIRILSLAKRGTKHRQISAMLGISLIRVRRSLSRTYAFLLYGGIPNGEGEPVAGLEPERENAA